jgi:multimeric flavodoxin WrbA
MHVIAVNGSPRKSWNTATLLTKALEGAAAEGAETELIHLYDLDFKGCMSCFACKRKGGASYGKCACRDGLTPVLKLIAAADALVVGAPVYLGSATGEAKSFLERLIFPYYVYDREGSSLFPRKMPVGFIYTLGADEERMKAAGFDQPLTLMSQFAGQIFGAPVETLFVNDTYQFDNYDKYVSSRFDVAHKAKRREEVFPQDCQKAFTLGTKLAAARA